MKKLLLISCLFCCKTLLSQADTTLWVRAFPITDYIVPLNDSVNVVQLKLDGNTAIKLNRAGILRPVGSKVNADSIIPGVGRCHLIKGEYYYFSIICTDKNNQPKTGDLLYTMVSKPDYHTGQVIQLASHYIGLKDVNENNLFDRNIIFSQWKKENEEVVLDSMISDIRFTGNYFLENNPDMNVKINGGRYDGKMVLQVMALCPRQDVIEFMNYVLSHPRKYAGQEWKISEIFATWLSFGAAVKK